MNPEEAVQTHIDLNKGDGSRGVFVPIHWATFNLAFHSWSEPIIRLDESAADAGTTVSVPMPGGRIDALSPTPPSKWWIPRGLSGEVSRTWLPVESHPD